MPLATETAPPSMLPLLLLLLSFSDSVTVEGFTKKWTPNVDFEDPVNWNTGFVPQSVDVAAFQEDTLVPVVLPSDGVNVCEMVLPANGQLIMEPDATIEISASSKETGGCTGQTIEFKRKTPMEWVDPDNWSNEQTNQATPHVERIPCEHDTVVFSPDNSFSVIMPVDPINIGSVKFGNQTFGQNELNEFLITDVGDQELRSSFPENDVSITLTDPFCSDPTGCECGTIHLLDQVCKVVSKRCNNKLGCLNPVKPIGNCCWICGAYYLINYNPRSFVNENFKKEFEKNISKIKTEYKKHELFVHSSKLLNGKVQIVLVSGTKYVDEIDEIAKTVHSVLISYTKRDMGIVDVKMINSGLSYDVDGMTYGQMALTTCIIMVCSMMAIIIYYTDNWKTLLFNSGSNGGAVFVKFENDTNDVELINEDERLHRKSSFDNPTYGAVDNLTQTQTFSELLSYSDLKVSTTNNEIEVELKERE